MSTQDKKIAKFKTGEIALWNRDRSKKKPCAFVILEVIEDELGFWYRVDRKNALAEHMLRKQTELEKGN